MNDVPDIRTLDDLTEHLVAAAQVELSTIPLYLYSLYSIKTKGYSQWAAGASAQRTITGVAIEEMLHMTLVRNLLVAIGSKDKVRYYERGGPNGFTTPYPKDMLKREPALSLRLRRLSTEHVETFIQIELPDDLVPTLRAEIRPYKTLGEFYARIEKGITYLSDQGKINWQAAKTELWKYQYRRGYWNQNGGADSPLVIVDKDTALNAMKIIVEQGEGAIKDHGKLPNPIVRGKGLPPVELGHWEDSHYTKFNDIKKGLNGIGVVCDDWGKQKYTIDDSEVIWPVIDDPGLAKLVAGRPVHRLTAFSNAVYCYLLALLDKVHATPMTEQKPDDMTPFYDNSERYGLERGFVASMQGVLYPVADLLVRTPLKPEDVVTPVTKTTHAGPAFEYYDFATSKPQEELLTLCRVLLPDYPELGGDDGVLRQVSLLPNFELPTG